MDKPYQVAFGTRINASLPTPAYLQVTGAIIRDIERGRLAHGAFLPSSRRLAAQLNLNRKTIVLAYEELISQGWLEAAGTRGTMVAARSPRPDARSRTHSPVRTVLRNDRPRPRYRILPTPPREPEGAPSAMLVDAGEPDIRLFSPDLIAQAHRVTMHRAKATPRRSDADPRGSERLRLALSDLWQIQRGLGADAGDILLTRGRQNGLFLTAKALLRPGDTVLVEELTYEPAVAAFRIAGAQVVPIRFNGAALDPDEVEKACRRHKVRAVYLTPHNQFPTTAQLSPEARLTLLNLAGQFGYAIIEDDYGSDFNFAPQPLLPMMAYAPEHVIYLGSLSTLIDPSIRIGYLHAAGPMIKALEHYAAHVGIMGNAFTEDAIADLIETGAVRRHANKAYKVYAERRDHTGEALRSVLGDRAAFDMPDSGLAFWLRFPSIPRAGLNDAASAVGLRLPSLHASSHAASDLWGLRFGYGSLDCNEATKAVQALGRALEMASSRGLPPRPA